MLILCIINLTVISLYNQKFWYVFFQSHFMTFSLNSFHCFKKKNLCAIPKKRIKFCVWFFIDILNSIETAQWKTPLIYLLNWWQYSCYLKCYFICMFTYCFGMEKHEISGQHFHSCQRNLNPDVFRCSV